MKKLLLALMLLAVSSVASADHKYLSYMYNDNVKITITNVGCTLPKIKEQYQWVVFAKNSSNNTALIGCYKKQDENMLEVQWLDGDISVFPGNVFLVDPMTGKYVKPGSARRIEI